MPQRDAVLTKSLCQPNPTVLGQHAEVFEGSAASLRRAKCIKRIKNCRWGTGRHPIQQSGLTMGSVVRKKQSLPKCVAGKVCLLTLTKKTYRRRPRIRRQPRKLAGNLDTGACNSMLAAPRRSAGGTCDGLRNATRRAVCCRLRRGTLGTSLLQGGNRSGSTNGNRQSHCRRTSQRWKTSWKLCHRRNRRTP